VTALLAQVVFPHFDGIPADRVVNSFCFITAVPPDAGTFDDINAALSDFFNVAPAGGNTLASRMSSSISRTAPTSVNIYDLTGHLDGTAHGSPVATRVFNLGAHAGTGPDLPEEVAICGSFRTLYATDAEFGAGTRPRARDRGRIYWGPLTSDVITQDSGTMRVRVKDTVRNDFVAKMAHLRDTPTDFSWAVWSRKNQTTDPVTNVWCDDAFDIIRARGEKAIVRTSG
jgi:hypothetical protein